MFVLSEYIILPFCYIRRAILTQKNAKKGLIEKNTPYFFFGSYLFFLAHIYFNWLSLFFSGLIQFNLATKGFFIAHKVYFNLK